MAIPGSLSAANTGTTSKLKDESRPFKDISDTNRKEGAKSSGGQILDAFVYHNYSIADLPGTVRAGKQVVSWGESTFIGNSINSINPVDVSAFRRPGAEIKEGLIPVNMLFATQSLTDQLTVEGFYQLEWDQTVVDNCGTFFGNDVVADGCVNNYTVGSPAIAPLQPIAAAFGQGFEVTRERVWCHGVATGMLVIPGSGAPRCAGSAMTPSTACTS